MASVAAVVPDTFYWRSPITYPTCSIPHPAAPPIVALDAIVVEESFLICLSAAYFDPKDSKMCDFSSAQLAVYYNPHSHIFYRFSIALLARQVYLDVPLHLFIP